MIVNNRILYTSFLVLSPFFFFFLTLPGAFESFQTVLLTIDVKTRPVALELVQNNETELAICFKQKSTV